MASKNVIIVASKKPIQVSNAEVIKIKSSPVKDRDDYVEIFQLETICTEYCCFQLSLISPTMNDVKIALVCDGVIIREENHPLQPHSVHNITIFHFNSKKNATSTAEGGAAYLEPRSGSDDKSQRSHIQMYSVIICVSSLLIIEAGDAILTIK